MDPCFGLWPAMAFHPESRPSAYERPTPATELTLKDNSGLAPDSGSVPRIEMVPIAALKPRENNPRKHSKRQIRKLADAIRQFGFKSVILIDRDNTIIAGHGRV